METIQDLWEALNDIPETERERTQLVVQVPIDWRFSRSQNHDQVPYSFKIEVVDTFNLYGLVVHRGKFGKYQLSFTKFSQTDED